VGFFRKQQHEQVRQPRISDDNESFAFRRSRTMTGSLSSSVRSASESHAALRSDRLKHHDLKVTRRRIFWLLVGCLVAIATLYGLLSQFISSVQIVHTNLSAEQEQSYHAAIETYLRSNPGQRFYQTLNTEAMTRFVQQSYPELKQVTLSENGFMQPSLASVTLRTAIAAWTLKGQRYYIDEHGVAFTKAPAVEPTLVVEDKTGIDPADAGAVASERMLHYIGRLVALVQQGGMIVSKVELPADTSRQVNVYVQGRAYPLKTHIDRDPAAQAADLVNAVQYFDTKNIQPAYVDVRVSSKAFYK